MSTRRRLATTTIAVLAMAVALGTGGGAGSAATLPTLYVSYTTSCTFTITSDSGSAVTSIAPGDYQVEVETPGDFGGTDLNGITDMTACKGFVQFKLTGPGVDVETTLDDGDSDYGLYPVTLQKSATYVAVDGNQPAVARVTFTTLASGTPVVPATSSPTTTTTKQSASQQKAELAVKRGSLAASVTAAGRLALTRGGKAVSALREGSYRVRVVDSSRKHGFALQGRGGLHALTGAAYVGTKTVTLKLAAGRWFFSPNSFGQKSYFVVSA